MPCRQVSKPIRQTVRMAGMALLIAIALLASLIFGHFEKGIPNDLGAARILLNKLNNPEVISSGCKFELKEEIFKCVQLSERLDKLKGEDEEIFVTGDGELVGVNFRDRVVVVLRPRRLPAGTIEFSCATWPKRVAPLGCRDVTDKH